MNTIARVGTVQALRRYPVKSMRGEELDQTTVDVRGILGDRLYAVRDADGRFGSGRNTRRFRRMDGLLAFSARYLSDLTPVITLPDGATVRGDDEHVHWALAKALGIPGVTLAKEGVISHFDEEPVHLVTSASLRWLADAVPEADVDARRLRPNMVIATDEHPALPEDSWVGRELHIGGRLVVEVTGRASRCVMVNLEREEPEPLRAVADGNELALGVHARVLEPGRITVGDAVTLA